MKGMQLSTKTTTRNGLGIVVTATITVLIMMVIVASYTTIAAIVNSVQGHTSTGGTSGGNNSFKVIVNIKRIDPTIAKAQIWVTSGNNVTESTTLSNPISLTNSSDEGGILRVEFQFDPGVIKVGDQLTACFKVLEDKDKEGTHFACQKGVNSSTTQPEVIKIVL
jgi:hypothetical protein